MDGRTLAGHNIGVDWRLLHRRHPAITPAGLIDTLRLTRHLGLGGTNSLSALTERFGLAPLIERLARDLEQHGTVERYCNETAAAILLPRELIQRELAGIAFGGDDAADDDELRRLSHRLRAGQAALLIALHRLGVIGDETYEAMEAKRRGRRGAGKKGRGQFYPATINKVGRRFARNLFDALADGAIDRADAGVLLGVGEHLVGHFRRELYAAGDSGADMTGQASLFGEEPRYCIDTNVSFLRQTEDEYYGSDVFAPQWQYIEQLIDARAIIAPLEVERELIKWARTIAGLHEWLRQRRHMFGDVVSDTQLALTKTIVNQYPVYGETDNYLGDPEVITLAGALGIAVISPEGEKENSGKLRPKIPNICREFGIDC